MIVRGSLIDASELPKEFRLFSLGNNETSQGTFVLDEAGLKSIMDAYRQKGIDLAIDYEHQTFAASANGKPAPAAGWANLEARVDGIWATNVRWTDAATAMLRNKEYRYFSPTFKTDAKKRIVQMLPIALTNDPATHNQEALVAASETATVSLSQWSTAQINNLPDSAFLHIEGGGTKDGEGKTTPRSLRHFPVRGPDGKVDMPHLRNALSRIPQSSLPASVKAAATAEAKRLMQSNSSVSTKESIPMNLAAIIGLKEDAPEGDVEGRVVALTRTESRLLEITGKDNVGDAIGVVIAAKDSAVKLAAAEKALRDWEEADARTKQDEQRKQIGALVDAAVIDGRVSLRDTDKIASLTSHGEVYGVEALKNVIAMLSPRPVRQYQAPVPANSVAEQLRAIEEFKKANPGTSTADAYVKLAAERPALFSQEGR